MSKDALASAYAVMLTDDAFRDEVAQDASVLDVFDLTDEERAALVEEATSEVAGFAIGSGPVMSRLNSGPRLSPPVASNLGIALNRANGLPTKSLTGPGFATAAGCCPWNKGAVSG